MKKAIEELKKIIKEKGLDKTDFTPVIDILVADVEAKDKTSIELENLKNENNTTKESIKKLETEKEELSKAITSKEKELADLKIKYIERFNDNGNGKIDNEDSTNENISIKDLFEEVK